MTFVLLCGCGKDEPTTTDDSTVQQAPQTEARISKITCKMGDALYGYSKWYWTDGQLSKVVVYNPDGEADDSISYTYDSGRVVRADGSDSYVLYSYSQDGLLTGETAFDRSSGESGSVTYSYIGGKMTHYMSCSYSDDPCLSVDYEYNTDGNIYKVTSSLETFEDLEMTYDNMKNPFAGLPQIGGGYRYWLSIPLAAYTWLNKNNVVQTRQESANTSYSYEYNDKGFPIRMTGTSVIGDYTGTSEYVFEYED